MRRQERLNWQIRMADGDMTRTQRDEFAALFPGVDPAPGGQDRADWVDHLDHVTLVSDGTPSPASTDHIIRTVLRGQRGARPALSC